MFFTSHYIMGVYISKATKSVTNAMRVAKATIISKVAASTMLANNGHFTNIEPLLQSGFVLG
jgi:hypothetical protein